jgi:hypothetical protein
MKIFEKQTHKRTIPNAPPPHPPTRSQAREMPKARAAVLIGILPSLAGGKGRGSHDLNCDVSCKGHAVPPGAESYCQFQQSGITHFYYWSVRHHSNHNSRNGYLALQEKLLSIWTRIWTRAARVISSLSSIKALQEKYVTFEIHRRVCYHWIWTIEL